MKKLIIMLLVIITTGCSCFWAPPQPYGPRVIGDSTGGAIVAYEDIKGGNRHDFYVQKISSEGEIMWGEEGVLVGGGYKKYDSYHELHIISDGSGGALVFWHAWPSNQQQQSKGYITSVDAGGNVRWQSEVEWADYMISDGAEGAIIATDSGYTEQCRLRKVDSEGKFPWGEDGVKIRILNKYMSNSLRLCGDDGGAIVIWEEFKSEPGTEPHSPRITNFIYAQKTDADGDLPWGKDGVLLYTSSEDVSAGELQLTSDGSGGAIATWTQVPRGIIEDDSPRTLLRDIYIQRVDSLGNTLWTDNGLPLETQKGVGSPYNYLAVSDDNGITVLWGGYVGYIQKIDYDGNMELPPGGMKVSDSSFSKAVIDGSGGVIVTFVHKDDDAENNSLYLQRINAAGKLMWNGTGTMVTEHTTYTMVCDSSGGAIVAWGIGKSTFSPEKSYVQRISAEGELLWGDSGIRLSP